MPMTIAHPEAAYTTTEGAAHYCGVTALTIRNWIKAGRLPAHRLGPRLMRIKIADLDALLSPYEMDHE